MLEKDLQKKFTKAADRRNMLAIKTDGSARRGWPDLTVIGPRGVAFVEVKTERGVVSELQKVMHERIRTAGGTVYVCRTLAQFESVLDSLGG